MTNTRTPSATVRFYDMPDGTVMTEVDMHDGYKGTPAQILAINHDFTFSNLGRLLKEYRERSILKGMLLLSADEINDSINDV